MGPALQRNFFSKTDFSLSEIDMSYPFKTVPVIKNYIWGGRKLAEV